MGVSTAHYLQTYRQLAPELNGSAWLGRLREEAAGRLEALGFPSVKQESWKYTNVNPILNVAFQPASAEAGAEAKDLARHIPEAFPAPRIVLVNGFPSATLSDTRDLPEGVTLRPLAEALEQENLQELLGQHVAWKDHPFASLNTALFRDGVFVRVARGIDVEQPIGIVHLSTAGHEHAAWPRHLVVAEESAQLAVVEAYLGDGGEGPYFNNPVTEIVAADNASVTHYKVENENPDAYHVASIGARLGRDARYASHNVCLGGALVRNDIGVLLAAEGGDCTLNGLYVSNGRQHVDNHTYIDHAVPRCTSRELYKGVLNDRARGVFDGQIMVRENAVKTSAEQNNRNLLLSNDAVIDTKPQLEIFNDDVKCAHGSAIGRLDEAALFYLRSRGLDREDARGLLTHAFAGEVIEKIPLARLRDWVDAAVWRKIPSGGRVQPAAEDTQLYGAGRPERGALSEGA